MNGGKNEIISAHSGDGRKFISFLSLQAIPTIVLDSSLTEIKCLFSLKLIHFFIETKEKLGIKHLSLFLNELERIPCWPNQPQPYFL